MKTIYLVRHAKSDLARAHVSDFDRSLNDRGMKAAPFMSALLKEKNIHPDLVLASPAKRALTTAELFCDTLNYPHELIEQRMEIYEGGAGRLLTIVKAVADTHKTIMLFGHNPTITAFANLLSGAALETLVTCAVVRIDLALESWSEADADTGELIWYEFPKKYQ